MTLVDSSVWIALIRNVESPVVHKLRKLADEQDDEILVGDLVLLELLQGARDDIHAARIGRDLGRYAFACLLDRQIAVRAAGNYRALRSLGITLRKTTDITIGTFCIENGHKLLHQDRDFDPMARHLGLQLA